MRSVSQGVSKRVSQSLERTTHLEEVLVGRCERLHVAIEALNGQDLQRPASTTLRRLKYKLREQRKETHLLGCRRVVLDRLEVVDGQLDVVQLDDGGANGRVRKSEAGEHDGCVGQGRQGALERERIERLKGRRTHRRSGRASFRASSSSPVSS